MSMTGHLDSLHAKHVKLEDRIRAEDMRPQPDADALHHMKVEKLHLKEEIEKLSPDR